MRNRCRPRPGPSSAVTRGSREKPKEGPITHSDKVDFICSLADEKKAEDIVIMEMERRSSICDYFVVMSAPSTVRVKAIVDHIEESMKKAGSPAQHKEGYGDAMWVLLDYAGVIVHIFYHETRKFYDLENLWGDAPRRRYIK